ncbi:transcriptional regulator [Skermanella stibiiresistens SB22]|uniref:Transcriptional regulator n=1 Tax=Skermanella stibiiresistens SB22 TaxID=1385369 RepID=W9H8W7_9PROT|nr:ROK family transcriptional regulator [Skermanella stibiiresistens]EWY40253.1 transcriptional regulator [Skermanella stibiiresistens SB22]
MSARVNSALIRQINIARVFHALREHPESSQRDLGRLTGLDKATVSTVVAQLQDLRLVERSEQAKTRRVGRPETALTIPRSAGVLVGVRLEPTTIRVVTTTLTGEVLGHCQLPGSLDVKAALVTVRAVIDRELAEIGEGWASVRAIGVGVPGLMDRTGTLVLAPNLGWRDVPIRSTLEEMFDCPVAVDNDTKAAAIAERLFGLCRTVEDYVYVTGDSGVGGALVLGGRVYRGASGFAGEIGHTKVVPDGRLCGCGRRGCLETYVSEAAILRRLAEQGIDAADIHEVAELAVAGRPEVRALLEEVGRHLGFALSNIVNMLNPTLILLGGNLASVGAHIIPSLETALSEQALGPSAAGVRVRVSPLGEDAVPMGGIALALDCFLAPPRLSVPRG